MISDLGFILASLILGDAKVKAARQREWLGKNRERVNAQRRAARPTNGERINAGKRRCYLANREKVLAQSKSYRLANAGKVAAWQKIWREKNKESLVLSKRAEYLKNREQYRATNKRWHEENPSWRKDYSKTNKPWRKPENVLKKKAYIAANPSYRAAASQRSRVWALLMKANAKRSISLGLEKEKLRQTLEAKFLPGMSWANYGSAWHVDHIVPCAAFDVSQPDQLRECFRYENLQPLWAEDNLRKGDKMPDELLAKSA